jgi:hypothetical protein
MYDGLDFKNTESIPLQADSGSLDGPFHANYRQKRNERPIGPFKAGSPLRYRVEVEDPKLKGDD